MGELVAFIIGWDLILEYGVSVAAVAVGWGGNVNAFLDAAFGVRIPDAISTSPEDGGVFNLPAVFIVMAITFLLIRGTRESAGANMIMVGIKIVDPGVLHRRGADRRSTPTTSSTSRRTASAASPPRPALIFFAYIGFDAVATGSRGVQQPRQGPAQAPSSGRWSSPPSSTSWSAIAAVGVAPIAR